MAMRFDAGEIITAMVTPMDENRKIDFSSPYWIYSQTGRSVALCVKNGLERTVLKSNELNVRPMHLLP